jgi:hypothetical protein
MISAGMLAAAASESVGESSTFLPKYSLAGVNERPTVSAV